MDFNSHVELYDEHCYRYVKQNLFKILYVNNSNVFMYRIHMDVKSNETTNQENKFRKNAFPQARWSIQSMNFSCINAEICSWTQQPCPVAQIEFLGAPQINHELTTNRDYLLNFVLLGSVI